MIRTHGLTKAFGPVTAVDGVDLDVREGDVYGFLGANGSGKTTTVRMVLGLVLATRATVELFGASMPAAASTVLPRVGALVEGPAAYPHLSGRANLATFDAAGRRGTGADRRGRIAEALEQVGLGRPTGGRSRLLARHAAAARARGRADPEAAAAGARRADERARPAGHPRDPRAAARRSTRRAPRSSCPATCSPRSSRCAPGSACSTAAGWCCRSELDDAAARRPGGSRVRTPDAGRRVALLDGRVETAGRPRCWSAATDPPALNA